MTNESPDKANEHTATPVETVLSAPPTHAEKVAQVMTWVLEGRSDFEIRETIAGNWPDASPHDLLLTVCQEVAESAAGRTHESVENWAFERTRFLYEKMIEIGEFTAALRAVRQMVDLSAARTKQVPPPQQVEHTHHHEIELGPITNDNIAAHKQRIAKRIACIGNDE